MRSCTDDDVYAALADVPLARIPDLLPSFRELCAETERHVETWVVTHDSAPHHREPYWHEMQGVPRRTRGRRSGKGTRCGLDSNGICIHATETNELDKPAATYLSPRPWLGLRYFHMWEDRLEFVYRYSYQAEQLTGVEEFQAGSGTTTISYEYLAGGRVNRAHYSHPRYGRDVREFSYDDDSGLVTITATPFDSRPAEVMYTGPEVTCFLPRA